MAYFVIRSFLYEVALFVFGRCVGDHLGCGYEKIEWIYRHNPIYHYLRGIYCQRCIFGNSLETASSEHDPKVGKEKKLLYNGHRSFGALAHL